MADQSDGAALAAEFEQFVRARVPADLLTELAVTYEDDDFTVRVHLSREPTAAEAGQLNGVIAQALEEFRSRAAGL
jgi:hypothetical protein